MLSPPPVAKIVFLYVGKEKLNQGQQVVATYGEKTIHE